MFIKIVWITMDRHLIPNWLPVNKPEYSTQRRFTHSFFPSGELENANAGIVSITSATAFPGAGLAECALIKRPEQCQKNAQRNPRNHRSGTSGRQAEGRVAPSSFQTPSLLHPITRSDTFPDVDRRRKPDAVFQDLAIPSRDPPACSESAPSEEL